MDIQEKRKLAHEYVMNYLRSPDCENTTVSNIVSVAWSYADAMEAQEKQRIAKGLPDALRNDGA